MFERILIAIDDSECARRAAALGFALARVYDSGVDVLHVLEGEGDDANARGRELLERTADRYSGSGVDFETHLAGGKPPRAILDHVEKNDVDLVVMGRHGRTGLRKRVLGTVTDRVLRRTEAAVLTVPDGADAPDDEPEIDTVLITTDGSENAERAGPVGSDVARRFDAAVHLLTVVDVQAEAGPFNAGGVESEYLERLEKRGWEAIERLERHVDAGDERSSVVRGISYEAIDEYATENGVDLIVMASEGESNLVEQRLGSVTDRVLHTVDTPVLVVFP